MTRPTCAECLRLLDIWLGDSTGRGYMGSAEMQRQTRAHLAEHQAAEPDTHDGGCALWSGGECDCGSDGLRC